MTTKYTHIEEKFISIKGYEGLYSATYTGLLTKKTLLIQLA